MDATKCLSEQTYQSVYSDPFVHFTMLDDTVRMKAYKSSINPKYFRNKTVLDVGCGSGILSFWAVEAGAKLVVGVDQANIAKQTQQVLQDNIKLGKLPENKIKIIHAKIESDKS